MNVVGRKACRLGLVVLLAALAAGAVSLAADERADRLQPMDIFKLQYASDPEISNDGQRAIYVRRFADCHDGRPAVGLSPNVVPPGRRRAGFAPLSPDGQSAPRLAKEHLPRTSTQILRYC